MGTIAASSINIENGATITTCRRQIDSLLDNPRAYGISFLVIGNALQARRIRAMVKSLVKYAFQKRPANIVGIDIDYYIPKDSNIIYKNTT